jgi:hypothetical protein
MNKARETRGKADAASRAIIINQDALAFLNDMKGKMESSIASLPDQNEVKATMDIAGWEKWFLNVAQEIIAKTVPDGYSIFYQTDRRRGGRTIDKSYLINKAAEQAEAHSVFHKIVLRRDVGHRDIYRPTFTHLICISKAGTSGFALEDVITAGRMVYENATGKNAADLSCGFLKSKGITKVYDLFCGRGSTLLSACEHGMSVVGVDIDPVQCKTAAKLLRKNNIGVTVEARN